MRPLQHAARRVLLGAAPAASPAALLALAGGAIGLYAQEPAAPPSPEQITRELTEVLALPAGSDDPRVALPRLGRFLDKYRGQDLARCDYAPAVYLFLNGDYDAAVRDLDSYFQRYAQLPVPGHGRIVGQIYVNAIREQASRPVLEPTRVERFALRALDLQQPAAVVGGAVHAVLEQCGTPAQAAQVRLAVVRRVLGEQRLDDAERDRALYALYGLDAPAAHRAPAAQPVELQATALSGRPLDLRALRGRVVLLTFWASWCPVSTAEAPALLQVYQRFHTQGFEVIGVAVDASSDDDVRRAAQALALPWEQVHEQDFDGVLAQRFGITSLPGAVLLDRAGVPCANGDQARGAALEQRLARLLAQ